MSDPAALAPGATFTYEIPAGKVGRLYWISARWTANGSATPRTPHWEVPSGPVDAGPVIPFNSSNLFGGQLTAGLSCDYSGTGPKTPLGSGLNRPYQGGPMPKYGVCMYPLRLYFFAYNIQAGDQISVEWGYKEQPL
jgi:hypothetical protein